MGITQINNTIRYYKKDEKGQLPIDGKRKGMENPETENQNHYPKNHASPVPVATMCSTNRLTAWSTWLCCEWLMPMIIIFVVDGDVEGEVRITKSKVKMPEQVSQM